MSSFAPTVEEEEGSSPKLAWQEGEEFFPEISAIPYEGADSLNPLAFKQYNASEVINGKTMEEWCRFGVCFWHTFRGKGSDPFGAPTMTRPWDDESDSLDNAFRRVRAAFEFMTKLNVKYYTFHDRDVAPEGKTIEESNANLDAVADLLEKMQQETGIKLLWSTQNLFSHPRYMNGGSTNPDSHVFAWAASQAKKILEVNHRLGGENVVFWGGREGYQSVLNTDVKREIDHLAQFFKMCLACTYNRFARPCVKCVHSHRRSFFLLLFFSLLTATLLLVVSRIKNLCSTTWGGWQSQWSQ